MAADPTTSVIVPAHNTDRYIDETIQSALAQTRDDLEVIVVDDGSTDRTRTIAEEWAARDRRVIVLAHPTPLGAATARNRAIEVGRGRYFALLDSDDVWLPTFLERQLAAFEECPDVAVVSGNLVNFGGAWDGVPYRPVGGPPRRVTLLEMIEHESAICISSVFKREVVERIGRFDPRHRRNEDYDFWLRAAAAGFRFLQTTEPLGRYRRRPDSVSAHELSMIEGILGVFRKHRTLCPAGSPERHAIEAQIDRFEREAMKIAAKAALRAGDYATAAVQFESLAARDMTAAAAAVAAISRHAPRVLRGLDRIRQSVRALRRAHASAVLAGVSVLALAGTAAAATIPVGPGDDLQHAIEAAHAGDTIALQAGATYTGNFVLPAHGEGSQPITIRTAGPDAVPAGQRMSPAAAPRLAKLQASNGPAVVRTAAAARFWRLELLEIAAAGEGVRDVVALGDPAQRTADAVPSDLVLDRVYVHGAARGEQRRGIALNAGRTAITNSYVADIKSTGSDSQAIGGWNGPGDYLIENNYLEAAGENIMFGGADPAIDQLTPTHIVIRGNLVAKPEAWRALHWQVKNLFELKNARDVLIERNVFEHNWRQAQAGYAILFTVRDQDGGCPWCQVEQVRFEHNIVRGVGAGVQILGLDNDHPSRQTRDVAIRGNLFDGIDSQRWGGDGYFLQMTNDPRAITIDHNTIVQGVSGGLIKLEGRTEAFVFTNNVASHGTYGIIASDHGVGNDSIRAALPGATIRANVIAGGDSRAYPSGNFFPSADELRTQFVDAAAGDFRLNPRSQWTHAATDGTPIGAPLAELPSRNT